MTRIKLIDVSATYYAACRFTMNGKEYQQDEVVPFDGLNEREIKRLINSTYITSIEPKKAAAPEKVVTPEKVVEPEKGNGITGKLTPVKGSRGHYEVQDEEGNNLLPDCVKGKDMARMAAEQLGITIVE